MVPSSGYLDALRRPASTGRNRCLPCTALNVAILAGCVLALARRHQRKSAIAFGAVGAGAIWLRGYLVPYTPRFAPRLVASLPFADALSRSASPAREPDSLSENVENRPTAGNEGLAGDRNDRAAGDAVLEDLLAAGVLVADGPDLALAPAVRARWEGEMSALGALDDDALARAALETVPTATGVEVVESDAWTDRNAWIVLAGEAATAETWLSRPVAIAEVAALGALRAFDLPFDTCLAAARPLRMFLTTCPDCGGRIEETTTARCCGGVSPHTGPIPVLACADCDERLVTLPHASIADSAP